MLEPSYAGRAGPWSFETVYQLEPKSLVWRNAWYDGRISYSAVYQVQVYKVRFIGSRKSYWRCVLHYGRGRKLRLQAAHHLGFRRIEDRTTTYIPFIKRLEARIAAANPKVAVRMDRHWLTFWDSTLGVLLVLGLRLTRIIGFDCATASASWLMRKIGPRLKGHRVARANLVAAYPTKSLSEIDQILAGMWDNIGRVFAEYPHLDRLWDLDATGQESGHIVLDEDSRKRFFAMRELDGPAILFTAHLANWELPAWALGCHKGETAVSYRPPKVASVERELANIRQNSKVTYVPAGVNGPFKIKNAMRRGAWIALLVDEHLSHGIRVDFFGRACTASPVLARLARQFNCPIYGSRMVRLPAGKFRLDITDPIAVPRDAAGKIEVEATTQAITRIIEGWVREYPEQWLWLQRRWR
jgi:KDO2-lipid IV(A) lauroyltransferase